jgi:hypothetical protein
MVSLRWGRPKSTGRSKSPGKYLRKCWKCGKTEHYKKDCKSKKVEKPKGYDSTSYTEAKTSTEEGGDVYLASTGTHAYHDVWLIDSGASYHMNPHKEWFSKYEKYDGGDVFLGDDSTTKKTTPYTPHKNGVAERMNKTLMEKSRTMLNGVGLGQEFWAKAVGTTCYLVNRSPSSTLADKTPHEVWSGKKPSLQHLRVFGCDSYVHVPKENRSKLDKKLEKCIFIGYKDGVKGYKLWNPETKKTIYIRDVVFREVKYVSKQEFLPTQDEPEKIELKLDDEKSESSEEEEVE